MAAGDRRQRDRALARRSGRSLRGCREHRPGYGSWCSIRHGIVRSLGLRRLFLGAGAVLMGTHDGAVDHRIFVVGVGCEMPEHPLPHAGPGPAAEAPMRVFPIAEALGQIAPRDARAITVEHRLDEQPVVFGRNPDVTLAPGQKVSNTVPLIVAQSVASHRSAPKWLTLYESSFSTIGNPLNDDRPSSSCKLWPSWI